MSSCNLYEATRRTVRAVMGADAFAMPLMRRSSAAIRQELGGGKPVETLIPPPEDLPWHPLGEGGVTDASVCGLLMLERAMQDEGFLGTKGVGETLIRFKNDPDYHPYFDWFAGPVTRRGLEKLEGYYQPTRFDKNPCEARHGTSGAVCRGWVAGLLHPGDPEAAIRQAVQLAMVTHPNGIAISGTAVSAALTAAAFGGKLDSAKIYDTALWAAQEGYRRGCLATVKPPVGAKLPGRIELAVNLALQYGDDDERLLAELGDLIGFGVNTSELIPSVVGILVAAHGSLSRAVRLAANAGNCANRAAVVAAAACAPACDPDPMLEACFERAAQKLPFDCSALFDKLRDYDANF